MKRPKIRAIVCLTFLPFMVQSQPMMVGGTPLAVDFDAAAGTNSNVGQAQRERDIINDRFISVNVGAAYRRELNALHGITARGFFETEQDSEVRGLSRLTAGGQFSLRGQFSPGPIAPSYQVNVTVQDDEYDHTQRDSTVYTAQLIGSKPLTDRITATTGIEYRKRDSSGTVFDLKQQSWFLNGTYALPPGWTIYGTYNFIYGDVWSTAQTKFCNGTVASDIYPLIVASSAIEPDDAFNNAFCGRWVAYRLSAHTNTLKIGVSKDIGNDMTLDFSALGVKVYAKGGNDYNTNIFRVGLSKRF
ncbi:MAG: hypothetical protein ACYDC8_09700 [Gammaproteobacteria bacterium]